MQRTLHKLLSALSIVSLWLATGLAADPIYKWEGPEGVMHFSETPPAASAEVHYEVLEFPPPPPSGQPRDTADYRSALDVADSLQAARLERERLRLERRRATESREIRREPPQAYEEPRYVAPWFVHPHRFRPHPGPGRHAQPHPDQPRVHRPSDTAPEPPTRGRVIVGR